jgi:negative regulator of replication initiation
MRPNGPAIKGGCVTRREHRTESRYFSQKTVTVQGGYGVLFAVMVQILLRAGAIAVQVL